MEPKKSKKSTIQNIIFIVLIALLLFSPLGTFVKVHLNRLIAFSPKTIAVTDQKMLSSYQWQLTDATGKTVSLEAYKGKIIFINFWATWCPPCRKMEPIINAIKADYKKQMTVLNVDGGANEVLMQQVKAEALPTFILYKSGKEVWRQQGFIEKNALEAEVKKWL